MHKQLSTFEQPAPQGRPIEWASERIASAPRATCQLHSEVVTEREAR
jgi:hypothetical protein